VHIEQSKTPLTEKPKFTVEDVSTKMAAIDRELKYLINKMKLFKPKSKAKPAKDANATEETSSSGTKSKSGMSPLIVDYIVILIGCFYLPLFCELVVL